MSDQQTPESPRQATVADILADLPKVQQIALRPLARNPLLGLVLEQATALEEIASWAGLCARVAQEAAAAPPVDLASVLASAEVVEAEAPATNGHETARPSGRRGG